MSNTHGGKRVGAGRPASKERHLEVIETAEDRFAKRLGRTVKNIFELADGGTEEAREEWEPAGTILIDGFEVTTDDKGNERVTKVKKLAFPDKPADELVLVKRVVTTFGPDLKANIYAADRMLGKPTARVEVEEVPEEELDDSLDRAIFEVYGEKTDGDEASPDDENDEPLEADESQTENAVS